MSEHCQYVVFPDDDRSPFVVETHPYPEHISDDLGGAIADAAVVIRATRCLMWVREDAATTGYRKNITASVIASMMNEWRRPVLVVGPAVLTTLIPLGINPASGKVLTGAEGFGREVAHGLAEVAEDVRQALRGSDGPFLTDSLGPDWGDKVRKFAAKLEATPIADDWPESENRPEPYDHISAVLEKRWPGTRVVPFEIKPLA